MATSRSVAGTAFQSLFLLIARVVFGLLLLGRAWWRWQYSGIQAQIDVIAASGLPLPTLFAWGTLVLEAMGGALIILGMLTRLTSAFVVAENVLVILWIKWHNGLFLAHGGFEYNAALIGLGIVFFGVGASFTGLDALLFGRKKKDDVASISTADSSYSYTAQP